jgi:hypothetical protein
VGALIPIVFLLDGERRADFVRFALGLGQPDARHRRLLLGSIVAVGALLGIAAAQPVLSLKTGAESRQDAGSVVRDGHLALDARVRLAQEPDALRPLRSTTRSRSAAT